jgi:hypothetical protein
MMQSAHQLLATEHPADGQPAEVVSDHSLTIGQETRYETHRHLISREFRDFVSTLNDSVCLLAEARSISYGKRTSLIVSKVRSKTGEFAYEANIPNIGSRLRGFVFLFPAETYNAIVDNPTPCLDGLSSSAYEDREFAIYTDGDRFFAHRQFPKDDQYTEFTNFDIDGPNVPRLPDGPGLFNAPY